LTEALLVASGLRVNKGGVAVLRDLSLDVYAGEVLGVFGPSGAGKSTLFRALAGEEPLAAGSVQLAGRDITHLPLFRRARLGLGYLPQTPSVLWDLSVADNLAVFAAHTTRPTSPARPVDLRALAEALGLGGRMSLPASALSGGERRRLELIRALSARPRVLLCDEPFAAIDPFGAEHVGRELSALAEAGAAVLIADRHVAEALALCHRAALLVEGELVVLGAPRQFAADPRVRKHYVVLPDTEEGPFSGERSRP